MRDFKRDSSHFAMEKVYFLNQFLPSFMKEMINHTFLPIKVIDFGNFDYGTGTITAISQNFAHIKLTVNRCLMYTIDDFPHLIVASC